jgi:hypothetical protein
MAANRISSVLQQSIADEVAASLDSITTKLPLITLTEKERTALPRFGPASINFVNEAMNAVDSNPGMMPGDFDKDEMKKDVVLYTQLYTIFTKLSALYESVEDTLKQVGSEAYTSSLAVYAMAKFKGKSVGGMNSTLDTLGKTFAKKTKKAAAAEGTTK